MSGITILRHISAAASMLVQSRGRFTARVVPDLVF